jgi:single-strand selective monofunctional uracil DNA glycosylase
VEGDGFVQFSPGWVTERRFGKTTCGDDMVDSLAKLRRATARLCSELEPLEFAQPVTHVYNPLVYARAPHDAYLKRYGGSPKRVVYLGMNPGPFGMAQTGVPFGEVALVRDWLGIRGHVDKPENEHPRRPIEGFACARSEVSGARLWGALKARYGEPEGFFEHGFIANYCPLVFMEESGKNRTPDKLARPEREQLFAVCDRYLAAVVDALAPRYVVGVGKFAADRAQAVFAGRDVAIATIPHPSPANPVANRGWLTQVDLALRAAGLTF